jgi:hypothetical protein
MRSGSGGGSISSNMTLLWHQLQLAAHQVRISSASTATAVDSAQSQHYKKLLAAFITAAQASVTCTCVHTASLLRSQLCHSCMYDIRMHKWLLTGLHRECLYKRSQCQH